MTVGRDGRDGSASDGDFRASGYVGLSDAAMALRFSAERGITVPVRFAPAATRALRDVADQRGMTAIDFVRLALSEATEFYLPPLHTGSTTAAP